MVIALIKICETPAFNLLVILSDVKMSADKHELSDEFAESCSQ